MLHLVYLSVLVRLVHAQTVFVLRVHPIRNYAVRVRVLLPLIQLLVFPQLVTQI